MDYIQLTCNISSEQIDLVRELLAQDLADMGFESFEDLPEGLVAYIPKKNYTVELASALPNTIFAIGEVEYAWGVIPGKNWNKEWEKNFQPVLIAEKCYIRAIFHKPNNHVPYELVIQPKMAFGTGHHETTSLMVEQMLSMDFLGKNVLDMGCGTGILAILASKLNAKSVLAIDIDEWAYQNSTENCQANHIDNVTIKQGDIDLIQGQQFDIILANINRNILFQQLPAYSLALPVGGQLLLCGIYRNDFDSIHKTAIANGFEHCTLLEKKEWVAALFQRK